MITPGLSIEPLGRLRTDDYHIEPYALDVIGAGWRHSHNNADSIFVGDAALAPSYASRRSRAVPTVTLPVTLAGRISLDSRETCETRPEFRYGGMAEWRWRWS